MVQVDRAELLFEIHERHKADQDPALVRLREQAHGQFVPHSGPVDRPILALVGEAPGRNEHRTGKPFVGPSGKVLDRLFKHIGLPRDLCYVTNAVHYRPVDPHGLNRTPTPEEIDASRPYLLEELRTVRPLVIATLGRVPLVSLVNTTAKVSAVHGMVARTETTRTGVAPLVTLYHPAVGVYQRHLIPMLEQDMDALAKVIRARGGSW